MREEVLDQRFRWSSLGDRKEAGFYTCRLLSRILNVHDMISAADLTNVGWDAEQSSSTHRIVFLGKTSVILHMVVQILWHLSGQHHWQNHNWLFMIDTLWSYLFRGFLQLLPSKNVAQLHCLWDCKMTFLRAFSWTPWIIYFIPT